MKDLKVPVGTRVAEIRIYTMEGILMGVLFIIGAIIIGIFLNALVIHIAAWIMGFHDHGFAAAVFSAIAFTIVNTILLVIFLFLGGLPPWWILLPLSLLLSMYILRNIYDITWVSSFAMSIWLAIVDRMTGNIWRNLIFESLSGWVELNI